MSELQLTSSFGEAVDFVRFLGLGAVKLLDLVNVRCFVERAAQTRLELSVVRLRVSFPPTTRVLRPFLQSYHFLRGQPADPSQPGKVYSVSAT